MSRYWTNWARSERSEPALVVAPRSVEQVRLAVLRALETGHTIKPIGASHSFSGIGATDGIRLDMSRMRGLVDVDLERGQVTLWAGTHLWELPAILNPLGLALENMGDVDRQTITGATQTGTHGTGLRFGGISTRIVGATIVTGIGEVLSVSETQHAELLPAIALGLGALGVLVTVTVQCVPRFLLRAVEAPVPLAEVLDAFEERNREVDHFEFYWFPHTEGTRTKTNHRMPVEDVARPLTSVARFVDEEFVNNFVFGTVVAAERRVPSAIPTLNRTIQSISSRRDYSDESHRIFTTRRRVRFREMEYALPLAEVPAAVRELQTMIERQRFRVSFPIEVRSAAADDLWMSTAHGRDSGYVAIHRYWKEPFQEYFRAAEAILVAHGGRPHWGKMHTRDAAQLCECYPRFEDFAQVRDRLDPERVFTNSTLDRTLGT
ncbi:D-arabinono-1,4-lactone oxidase [Leucobacter sp. Z1108]|uniref:D-arabinono-1,4-lactone oxidase n=1 Tax=Leucobacter sp. Z1108 TaxID=3439066 RepID=UPI003F2CA95D